MTTFFRLAVALIRKASVLRHAHRLDRWRIKHVK